MPKHLERETALTFPDSVPTEEIHRTVWENCPEGICILQNGVIVAANPQSGVELDYSSREMVGSTMFDHLDPDYREMVIERYQKRLRGEEVPTFYPVKMLTKDGRSKWLKVGGVAIQWKGGPADLMFVTDIDEQMTTAENLARSLQEKEILLREVHHRVTANLRLILNLINLNLTRMGGQEAQRSLRDLTGHITAMSHAHELLLKSDNFTHIELDSYLGGLVDNLFQLHAGPASRVELRLDLEGIGLDMDRTLACGMIVNELSINSLKHAFPRELAGLIEISGRILEDGRVELVYQDDGVGPPPEVVRGEMSGLGLGLVKNLVETQLMGSLEISGRPGMRVTLRFARAASPA